MADLKISQLTGATTPLAGTEVVPLVQSGTTKKVSVANLTAGRDVGVKSVQLGTVDNGVIGSGGWFTQTTASVAAGGTLDLTMPSTGFVGILSISNTRDNYPPQSRRQVLAVACYGTTLTSTNLFTSDGAGGGPTYSITVPSAGVIRWTDTSGDGSTHSVYLTFSGSVSAG
jgi:hypothetical protein